MMNTSSIAIQTELDRVLESRCFRSRKAAQRFLKYVVAKTTKGEGKHITQHSIAVEALKKAQDFDPSSNPLIRVQAGRLRKQLEEYYAGEGRENLLRIMLPTGSYQPAFIDREEHQKINTYAGKPKSPGTSQGPTLVCVPRIFTYNKEAGWVNITRFTRDYVIKLTHFNFCQVLFADENKSQRQIWPDTAWEEYRADFALLFDLYDDGDGYSLKCSLTHSKTRQIVWGKSYKFGSEHSEETLFRSITHDTVSLEQGIAHDFWARYLLDTQTPIQPQYQVMIALRKCLWDMNRDTLHHAQQTCQQRLETLPRDVQNLIVYVNLFRIAFLVKLKKSDELPKSVLTDLTNRLMCLAPGNAHTHTFQALANLFNRQFEACEENLQKALQANSLDTELHVFIALIYMGKNDWDKGTELAKGIINNTPVYPDWYNVVLAFNFARLGDNEQAIKVANNIKSDIFWGPLLRAAFYRRQGLHQQAKQEQQQLDAAYPDFAAARPANFSYIPSPARDIIIELWKELTAARCADGQNNA